MSPIRDVAVAMTYEDGQLLRRFARTEKQFIFGTKLAIRDALLRLQKAQFEQVRSRVQIRKDKYFFGTPGRPGGAAARVTQFPTLSDKFTGKARLYGELALQDVSKTHTGLLPLFESGGERRPFTPGAKHVASPITGRPARPNWARGVVPEFTFANLAFKGYRRGKLLKKRRRGKSEAAQTMFGEFGAIMRSQLTLSGVQWKGRNRTFILLHSKLAPEGGVFQRFGPERGDVRLLYAFLRPFRIEPRLDWVANAERLGPIYLHEEVERQAIDIITHNAGKAA